MTINEILDSMRCYNKETMNNLNHNLIAKTIFCHLCANDSMRYVEIFKKKRFFFKKQWFIIIIDIIVLYSEDGRRCKNGKIERNI
jgi:hypothetical protein